MKIITLILLLASNFVLAQQKQHFDMVRYTIPNGWQQSTKPKTVSISKEDKQGNYCIITIYKSVESGSDSRQNFDVSWESLVQKTLATDKAVMQPAGTDNGWTSETGSAPFEKDGLKGAVILITNTSAAKMVNIVILTNTQLYQKEMENFLNDLSFSKPETNTSQLKNSTTAKKESITNQTQNVEIWMNVKISAASGSLKPYYPYGTLKPSFYVVYPNGDYYPHFPPEGMLQFNNENKNESWGKFTLTGNKGRFQSKYENIAVEKISATEMKKTGYSAGFYKCVPVDGLRLNGQWGSFAGWDKDPVSGKASGINGTGVRAVIEFTKEGNFTDYGAFVTNLLMPNQVPQNAPGKGTYHFENFTLVLRYNDERIAYKSFTGAGNKNPAAFNKLIYIGNQPFYSK